ncbi:MAG: hydroxylamine reductase, partial [Candidatus Margulisbacteria bacterium]|nr:hydroxylamine reductase [Candidatus Margulisiibacteriota bacterium]
MYCDQCEQSVKGGCQVQGVCGKGPETSDLQDQLLREVKVLAYYIEKGGKPDEELDLFIVEALFSTVTNVSFDDARLRDQIKTGAEYLARVKGSLSKPVANPPDGLTADPDLHSLKQLLAFGLKGMAAYLDHASLLGKKDQEVFNFIRRVLASLLEEKGVEELIALNLECGKFNIRAMELLNQGHIERFGRPEPTKVSTGTKKGPAILVSGHDLLDLEEILKQTTDKGINVYTHGEMLPAHGYPGLKKYKHLAGNFGGAWQDQQKEFAAFPGAILMTTNCIQRPSEKYRGNIFTTGLVAFPGVRHIKHGEYAPLINKSLELGGFPANLPGKEILVGFGHDAVLGAAEKVIGLVKSGKIKRFFLIGGCDGAKSGRNYYTEFAEKAPADSVILTLACGKYRFNKLDFGEIEGIPRLLDIGQCNDAYSAIQIAAALAKAFNVGLNDLPLSLILSWYEQKAVVILLSLLYLGIKNIRLG